MSYARRNRCSGRWDGDEARETAYQILAHRDGHAIVLLGAKVARTFGLTYAPFTVTPLSMTWADKLAIGPDCAVVVLPHPSGRCRLWNDPDSVDRARACLRDAGALW